MPSDQYDSSWTFEGGIHDITLFYNVEKKLAFESTWPKWKVGSEFKANRDNNKQ